MLPNRGSHDRIRADVLRIWRTDSSGDFAAATRADPDEATFRISRPRASASLAAFDKTIPDLPRDRTAVPPHTYRRRSILDVPQRKRHQLLPLCEAAAVLDCSVGLHRRQPRIRLLRGASFCALDLLGPAAALHERIARYRAAGEYKVVKTRKRETVMMLLRWLALVALLFSASWLLTLLLKWVLLGVAGNNAAVVLTMTALLVVIHFLTSIAAAILSMVALACKVSVRFLQRRPDVTLPESLIGEETALMRRAAGFLRTGWALLAIFMALTIYVGVRLVNAVHLNDATAITAHRGSSIAAPENTMAAILKAIDEGADFVEIDVQETKDGTVVLAHDKDLNRVFGINRRIWEVTYDELKDLDSGGWFSPKFSDQRIATLSQVIEAVKGHAKLNIELKFNGHDQKLASEVVRIINEHDFARDCIVTSLDYDGIRQVRAASPGIRTGLIVTSALGDITGLKTDVLGVSLSAAVTRDLIARAHRGSGSPRLDGERRPPHEHRAQHGRGQHHYRRSQTAPGSAPQASCA